ncbi:hypothetical protein SAMN05446635_2874 [Burkholderia sp. OK233]|nr:hypothetical protein SAMN05446635_2874 [Burkholderia sp. OK233]
MIGIGMWQRRIPALMLGSMAFAARKPEPRSATISMALNQ